MKLLDLVIPNLYLFIVMLCELTIKYVIQLGRFVRILEDQLKWWTILFNVQQNMVVCMCQDLFSSRPMGLLDLMV
jgi:hypothetical protein